MKKVFILLGGVVVILLIVLLLSAGCKTNPPIPSDKLSQKTLKFWGVWDDSEDVEGLIETFQSKYSNIKIEYRKLKPEEYEETLYRAWSAGEGPDIFMFHNTWTHDYQKYLYPAPESIQMAKFTVSAGALGKEERKVSLETYQLPQVSDIKKDFVDVVAKDVIIDEQIYGLPLSVDTLALYYNKDLLANANIFLPPTVWDEFKDVVPLLTKQDEQGNIIQAGTALGTSANIDRSVDLLSLLMLQNGTTMIDAISHRTAFADELKTDKSVPGQSALDFYTSFSSPSKVAYSWNETMADSLETFIHGQLAFMFGYSYHLKNIKQRDTRLNFDITPMIHINADGTDNNPFGLGKEKINYANYWVWGAYKDSSYPEEAWNFIRLAALDRTTNQNYLAQTNKPGALREILNAQKDDSEIGVFAEQALSAQSWYTGYDANSMGQFFTEMINNVTTGRMSSLEAIKLAAEQVNKTLSPR